MTSGPHKAPAMDGMLTLNWEINMNSYPDLLHCHTVRKNFTLFLFMSAISLITLQGCGTLANGHRWGEDATISPGWERVKKSAVNAALSPETWGPVAGALVLQVDHMDKRISNWATTNHPVFGSQQNASNVSDAIEFTTGVVYVVTVMAEPGGDDRSEWIKAKAKGLAVCAVASGITAGNTFLINTLVGRERPNGVSNSSFPSGHASSTAVLTTLARRNLDSLSLSPGMRTFYNISIAGMAVGMGWGRVESKKHYPSDVLVGYAFGHFFSAFINDAFLGVDNEKAPQVTVTPSRKGIQFGMNWTF
jgi:hypothetical protein